MSNDHYLNWIKIVKKCRESEDFKKKVLELCAYDIQFFFDTFLFTYDPRIKGKIIPFQMYDFQKRAIQKLEENYRLRKSILFEKSRDMGFSWFVLAWILHHFLFDKGFSAGIASRKSHLVDDLGNMNALIPRIRFMLSYLPKFFLGSYDERKNSKIMGLFNPSMETSITGESGDEIGRGGRTSVYLIDEFAFIPRSSIVHAAVSQTTDMIIYGSTPNGKGNEFARLRWKTNIDRVTLHWKDHPKKDDAWYQKQKETLDETIIAQEIDISYEKSAEGRVYKQFDTDRHASTKIDYDKNFPVHLAFDWGIGDPTACVMIQDVRGIIRIIDSFERKDMPIDAIFSDVSGMLHKYGLGFKDVASFIGDPDGRNRNIVTGNSISSFIKTRYGVNLRYKLPNSIKNRVNAVRSLINANRIIVDKNQSFVIECFQNYRYPGKEHGENEKPLHNWCSHTMSAIEYYCDYYYGMDQFKIEKPIEQVRFR